MQIPLALAYLSGNSAAFFKIQMKIQVFIPTSRDLIVHDDVYIFIRVEKNKTKAIVLALSLTLVPNFKHKQDRCRLYYSLGTTLLSFPFVAGFCPFAAEFCPFAKQEKSGKMS